jgi:hypothetical protein
LSKRKIIFWCVLGAIVDCLVVYKFIAARPPASFGPQLPIQRNYPDIPPSVSISLVIVGGILLAVAYICVAFAYNGWILKAFVFVLVVVWLVFTFSWIYDEDGNEPGLQPSEYPAFGSQLSKNEALYFTVGILTTAGAGDLSPKTDSARAAVIVQMSLGVIVLVSGVAGVVREPRRSILPRSTAPGQGTAAR